MPVTKHTLTLGKDTITGVSGVDLFVAPAGTLNSLDVLEGGGGVDTIAVDMITTFAHPTLKHIEKAIFTHTGAITAGLDLINAKQLASVEFDAFKSDATIKNADVVNEIILNNDDNHKISILDIDTTKVALQKISALNSTDESLNIQTDGNLGIHKLDVTLNNSKLYLGGDTAATELVIHSISKDDNTLLYHTDGSQQSIQKVTVDGSAALNFGITQTMAFRSMTRFDAARRMARSTPSSMAPSWITCAAAATMMPSHSTIWAVPRPRKPMSAWGRAPIRSGSISRSSTARP